MASGSPAELIPFTRFLERRQQLHRIAVANGTLATLESAHLAGTASAGGPPSHESATVRATMSPGGLGIV